MAKLNNIKLSIGAGTKKSNRKVTVTYTIAFTQPEVLAGSVFDEKILLRGDDPLFDDNLILLQSGFIKAQNAIFNRSFSQIVSTSDLDEDGDVKIGGVIVALADELYARVTLVPFTARGDEGDSNLVAGQFGLANVA